MSPTSSPARPRSAETTRARILGAARAEFARRGYDGTTIRAVATAAEVDPALVMRYFDSKAGLFAEAADLELGLPDLTGLGHTEVARALADRFFEVWEGDDRFLVLLRAAATSEAAATRMREIFTEQAGPALARVAVDRAPLRVSLAGTQVIGFAFGRYVLRVPALVAMTREDVVHWLGAAVVRFLTHPDPGSLG